MALLKRQASQELLPTRAPKLARGQDASALSRLGARIITNTVKLLSSNASAFYEGTRLVTLALTHVMRFRSSRN